MMNVRGNSIGTEHDMKTNRQFQQIERHLIVCAITHKPCIYSDKFNDTSLPCHLLHYSAEIYICSIIQLNAHIKLTYRLGLFSSLSNIISVRCEGVIINDVNNVNCVYVWLCNPCATAIPNHLFSILRNWHISHLNQSSYLPNSHKLKYPPFFLIHLLSSLLPTKWHILQSPIHSISIPPPFLCEPTKSMFACNYRIRFLFGACCNVICITWKMCLSIFRIEVILSNQNKLLTIWFKCQ